MSLAGPAASAAPAALEMRGISRSFGATRALDDVDFVVRPGAVHALLGENGAGKSTLMHIAYGVLAPDRGRISTGGSVGGVATRGPRAGVGMVHQHLSLVPAMTAAENFVLGGTGVLRLNRAAQRLEELGARSGLRVDADAPVRELSIVQQQRIEILKALGRDATLLIMDEPTAVLAPEESRALLAWIREFAASGGSVVLVTHKLREALSVADDITVLRRGRVTWTGAARGATESQLANAIFPEALPIAASASARTEGEVVVRATNLRLTTARGAVAVRGASFALERGEIVGVAAVEGSGHRELLAALARLAPPAGGVLELPARISYVPAHRRRDAIIEGFSLTENVALRSIGVQRGLVRWDKLRERTVRLITRFSITAPGPDTPAGSLSGGNQQRLVVARELDQSVDLVIADNPTRGLDVNATAFVHEQLRNAARTGAAVVVHASDLDDVLVVATRVLVVFNGTVSEPSLDREAIGRAMLGAA